MAAEHGGDVSAGYAEMGHMGAGHKHKHSGGEKEQAGQEVKREE